MNRADGRGRPNRSTAVRSGFPAVPAPPSPPPTGFLCETRSGQGFVFRYPHPVPLPHAGEGTPGARPGRFRRGARANAPSDEFAHFARCRGGGRRSALPDQFAQFARGPNRPFGKFYLMGNFLSHSPHISATIALQSRENPPDGRLTPSGRPLSSRVQPDDLRGRDRFPGNRRRRSNRPGNSQANGPREDGALESGVAPGSGGTPTEGESRPGLRPDTRRSISQVQRQRGQAPPEAAESSVGGRR